MDSRSRTHNWFTSSSSSSNNIIRLYSPTTLSSQPSSSLWSRRHQHHLHLVGITIKSSLVMETTIMHLEAAAAWRFLPLQDSPLPLPLRTIQWSMRRMPVSLVIFASIQSGSQLWLNVAICIAGPACFGGWKRNTLHVLCANLVCLTTPWSQSIFADRASTSFAKLGPFQRPEWAAEGLQIIVIVIVVIVMIQLEAIVILIGKMTFLTDQAGGDWTSLKSSRII